jgi:hypothetical protein
MKDGHLTAPNNFFESPHLLLQGEGVKKLIFKEGEWGYWRSFRAIPFYRELLTMKNLNHIC